MDYSKMSWDDLSSQVTPYRYTDNGTVDQWKLPGFDYGVQALYGDNPMGSSGSPNEGSLSGYFVPDQSKPGFNSVLTKGDNGSVNQQFVEAHQPDSLLDKALMAISAAGMGYLASPAFAAGAGAAGTGAGAEAAGAAALPAGGMTATGTLGAAPWTTDVMGANALGSGMFGTSTADIGGMMGTSGGFGAMGSGFAGVPAADLGIGGSSAFSNLVDKFGSKLGRSAVQNILSDVLKSGQAAPQGGGAGGGLGMMPAQQALNYSSGAGPLQQMSIAKPFGFSDVMTHPQGTSQAYDPLYNG